MKKNDYFGMRGIGYVGSRSSCMVWCRIGKF